MGVEVHGSPASGDILPLVAICLLPQATLAESVDALQSHGNGYLSNNIVDQQQLDVWPQYLAHSQYKLAGDQLLTAWLSSPCSMSLEVSLLLP